MVISPLIVLPVLRVKEPIARLAPSRAKARAIARPIPLAPPVTTATLPFSLMCLSWFLCWPQTVICGQVIVVGKEAQAGELRPPGQLAVGQVYKDRLSLSIGVIRLDSEVFTQPALLLAAIGNRRIPVFHGVRPDHSGLNCARHSECAAQISSPE